MLKFSITRDNLLGIVLADGGIVRAAVDENPHLLWAVRGRGGNFEWCRRLSFVCTKWGRWLPEESSRGQPSAHETLRLFRDLAARATDEGMLVAALMTASHDVTKVSAIAAGYFGPSAIAERVVKPIKAFDQTIADELSSYTAAGHYISTQSR